MLMSKNVNNDVSKDSPIAVQFLNFWDSNFNLSIPNKFKLICLLTPHNQLHNFSCNVFNVVSYKCLILLEMLMKMHKPDQSCTIQT